MAEIQFYNCAHKENYFTYLIIYTEHRTTLVTVRSYLNTKHHINSALCQGWSVFSLKWPLNKKHKALTYSRYKWLVTAHKDKQVMLQAEATQLSVSDSANHFLLHTSASPPPTGAGWLGYHGNQDGYAAKTGGAVIPDVSWYKAVLPDQEEELHFQVQTQSTNIQQQDTSKEILYFPLNLERKGFVYSRSLLLLKDVGF